MNPKTLITLILILNFSTATTWAQTTNRIKLKLMSGSTTWDNINVIHNSTALDKYEQKDAGKMFNPDADLYTISSDNVSLSLDSRPFRSGLEIPLGIKVNSGSVYYFKVESSNIADTLVAVLHDNVTGQNTPMITGQLYSFTITQMNVQLKTRFKIKLQLASTLALQLNNFSAEKKNNTVVLKWNVTDEKEVNNYVIERGMDGRSFEAIKSVSSSNSSSASYSFTDENAGSGNIFYRLKIINKDGSGTYSQVLRITSSKGNISAYPNPVKGSTLNLQITDLPRGNYEVSFYNLAGQKVATQNILLTSQSSSQSIRMENAMKGGLYNMVVSGNGERRTIPVVFE